MRSSEDMDARDDRHKECVVDVAVPAYRRATFIGEAIQSVVDQRFGRWRLTVCDNGPGGGAIQAAVTPFLSDPRVSYLATGRELPLFESWTNAIRQGRARYVALLNDDDRWHAGFLEARVNALDLHPKCGFAFGEWVEVDAEGRELGRAPFVFPEGVLARELLASWFTRQNIVPPALLIRRSALEAVGPAFDGRWHYCDWEMWARIAARFPAFYLRCQDCDIRRHLTANAFVTSERPDRLVEMVAHIERMFESELDGFELSWQERRRNRSRILLNAASDVHQAGGWNVSGALHSRAMLEYPPTLFAASSLRMIARSLLGRRRAQTVGRALRSIDPRRARSAPPDGSTS